jgi:hypothetical protein
MAQALTLYKENYRIPTRFTPRRSWILCTQYKDKSNFQNILNELDLSAVQKQIIITRYLSILENFQRRSRNYSYLFFSGHFIITVGSLFVPALLSIQNSDKTFTGNNVTVEVYWATFVISLLVTIFNGVLTLFKIDKKYYFLNTTLERLRSEGWQYFSLTGRYASHNNSQPTTHANQFLYFTHYIEKIKMKQVEEEYYKADEKIAQTPTGNNTNSTTVISGAQELYPPSPDQPLNTMTGNVPEAVKDAVNSLIKSQTTIKESDKNENVVIIPERSEGGAVVTVFPENKVITKVTSATDLNSILVNK